MSIFVSPAFTDATVIQVFRIPKERPSYSHQQTGVDMQYIQTALFGNIQDDFDVVQPLPFKIEQEDGTFVVSDDIFFVYGDGDNRNDAVADYIASLIEYYHLLKKNVDNNPFDRKQFAYLQTYLKPKTQRGYDAIQATRD